MTGRCRNSRDPERDYGDSSEFGFGPGPVAPGFEGALPLLGGVYRAMCAPVEIVPSDDLSVRVRQVPWEPGMPVYGNPGERVG